MLDAITATATGEILTPQALAARLGDVPLIFFGESHTNSGASSGNQRPLPSPVFHPVLLDCLLVLIPDGWQSSILSGHAPDHRPVLVLIAAR